MSDISCVDALPEGVPDEINSVTKQRWNLQDYILLLPFFLLFIGDFQLPIGDGVVTIPMGMVLVFPAIFWYLITGRLALSISSLLLAGVLFCGLLGFLFTPLASFSRSVVGALPVVFAALTIVFYERYPISQEKAVRYMLAGGVVLAIAVIILFVFSLGVSGDYYDQKLIIETPLGRSNYLAAFLLFLFALSVPRNIFTSILFLVAIFCTLSRGGVLALVMFFALIPFLRRKKVWILGVGVGAVVVVVWLLVAYLASDGIMEYVSTIFNLQDAELDSVFNRFQLWSFGVDIFSDYPVFGVGPNTFRTFVELAGDVENVWGVHNSVLLILLNYGIFGLIFYLIYLGVIYKNILLAEKLDDRFFYLRAVFLVLLVFGFYEPLVGSAAFEVLLALVFVLARARVRIIAN